MTEIQIRRRRTRFKTKKEQIGPPDGVVDKSDFCPKTKNSAAVGIRFNNHLGI